MPNDLSQNSLNRPMIVAVGASTGGYEVLQTILARLTAAAPLAIVIVQHLREESQSLLEQLLREHTKLKVISVRGEMTIRAGHVYLAPARQGLDFTSSGDLKSTPLPDDERHAPIDHFFNALAAQEKEMAVGVVLSGGGTDGALGLKAISDAGGMTVVQTPTTAQSPSMPESAAASGVVDYILEPEVIAGQLIKHAEHMLSASASDRISELTRQIIAELPAIAAAIEKQTDNDFKHYKTTTLVRRVRRRMQVLKINEVSDYLTLLRSSSEEAQRLFRELLISVTEFFRDPQAFELLRRKVLDRLCADSDTHQPLRVWVAGCATGEEAYSLAMLIRESMDNLSRSRKIQIFATDLDDRGLQLARSGSYPIGIEDELSAERLERFFVKRANRYFVTKEIRDMITFSAHNLISDPPFTRLDLIVCRNLLIYLGPHLQQKLIPLFHYALQPTGYLFLGPAESMSGHKELFVPLDATHRIYQRKSTAIGGPAAGDARKQELSQNTSGSDLKPHEADLYQYGQRIVLDEFAPQWVIVDDDAEIYALSADTSAFLSLGGGTFRNSIINMAKDELRPGLRLAFSEAKRRRRKSVVENLSIATDAGLQRVNITVQPMPEVGQSASLHMIVFQRVGEPLVRDDKDGEACQDVEGALADASLSRTTSLIEHLEKELAATRTDLERTVQELEVANEELKATNEELLSMNEELQSANEELNTSKEELQSSNETLASRNSDLGNLLRSTEIATIFLDKDNRIRSFTPAATAIYSLLDSDIGRPLSDLTAQVKDMPPLPIARQTKGLKQPLEHTLQTTDGRWFIRRVLPYETFDGTNDGWVLTFADVTDLRTEQDRLQMALLGGNLGVWDLDLRTGRAWRSPMHDLIFGYERMRSDWSVDVFLQHVHADDRVRIEEFLKVKARRKDRWSLECRICRTDGETRWIAVQARTMRNELGKSFRMVGTIIDFTERKQQAEFIENSEAHLRRIIDNMVAFVGVLDVDGTLLEANRTAIAAGGIQREDVLGKKFWDCYWWAGIESEVQRLREALETARSGQLVRYDAEVRMAGDSRMTIDFMLAPVFDSEGNVTHLIPSGVDITDRKLAERELKQAREMAEVSNQAKSDFLANMSHEIRSPMTAILGFADLLKTDDEEERQKVETIRRNGHFLLELINDILDLSKIEAGKVDIDAIEFSPTQLLEDVCSLMSVRAAESGLELMAECAGAVPVTVKTDAIRLRQILINLVGNALKFTDEGYVKIKMSFEPLSSQLRFDIIDTGIGISRQQLCRLFRPFEQGDASIVRKYGGSGLGLAISQRLAELLGGSIAARSELGRGSTFTLSVTCDGVTELQTVHCPSPMPLVAPGDPQTAATGNASSRNTESWRLDIRVLIVDDRRDIRFLSQHFVQELGAQVLTAENGSQALEIVAREEDEGRPIDIILMDVQMPVMDGFTAVRRLRERGFQRPIVALTANAMESDREACFEAGYTEYLSKPIDKQKLIETLRRNS